MDLSSLSSFYFFFGMRLRFGTLGARGFSCAVSGFGQVLKGSACDRRNEAPRRTREKTSGTQGSALAAYSLFLTAAYNFSLKSYLNCF